MRLITKLINLLLISPITQSNCYCTTYHPDDTFIWEKGYVPATLECSNETFSRSVTLKSVVDPDDFERINYKIIILNSSVPIVEYHIFDSAEIVEKLVLDNDGIIDINENSFEFLNHLTDIKINNNPLKRIREKVFNNLPRLEYLDLSHNQIDSIDNINDMPKLKVLNVSYNELRNINNSSFSRMQVLETLDLSGNLIEKLDPHIFDDLPNLNQLYLNNNSIIKFALNKFKKPIKNLDLSLNFISSIVINHSENFILYNLDYSDNYIEILNKSQFAILEKLTTLFLDRNMIKQVDVTAFKNLYNLTTLSLSDNQITTLYPGTFHELSILVHLNLSWNQIESLPSGIFTGLNNLRVLDLSENRLHSIPQYIFYPIRYIQELYLHGNSLGTVSTNIFTSFTFKTLKHLSLDFKQEGCATVGHTLKRLQSSGIKVKQGHKTNTHNIHGIACDPDIKDVDSHREEEDYEKQLFRVMSHFPTIEYVLIVLLVISIVVLVIKSLTICDLDMNYIRKRFFGRKQPAGSSNGFVENDED